MCWLPNANPIFVTMINPSTEKGLMVYARIAQEVSLVVSAGGPAGDQSRGSAGRLAGAALAGASICGVTPTSWYPKPCRCPGTSMPGLAAQVRGGAVDGISAHKPRRVAGVEMFPIRRDDEISGRRGFEQELGFRQRSGRSIEMRQRKSFARTRRVGSDIDKQVFGAGRV